MNLEWSEYHDCGRCGIRLPEGSTRGDWCRDCLDVEGITVQKATTTVQETFNGESYKVGSSRRGPISKVERDRLMGEVDRLTGLNYSANQIALTLGLSTRTVTRYRQETGVYVPPKRGIDYVRDREALKAGQFKPGTTYTNTATAG